MEQVSHTHTPPQTDADAVADPANNDDEGHDWSTEGGATPAGPATSAPASDASETDTDDESAQGNAGDLRDA